MMILIASREHMPHHLQLFWSNIVMDTVSHSRILDEDLLYNGRCEPEPHTVECLCCGLSAGEEGGAHADALLCRSVLTGWHLHWTQERRKGRDYDTWTKLFKWLVTEWLCVWNVFVNWKNVRVDAQEHMSSERSVHAAQIDIPKIN